MKVLATNGGPHPADKWAEASAEQITATDPNIPEDKKLAAEKLRLCVIEALVNHHQINIDRMRERLKEPRPFTDTEVADLVQAGSDAVRQCAKGTPWEGHYAKTDVDAVVKDILARHFAHARKVEADWADPDQGIIP